MLKVRGPRSTTLGCGRRGSIATNLGDAVLAVDLEGVGGEGGESAHRHVGDGKRLRARGQPH
jgi:hypothetical protein